MVFECWKLALFFGLSSQRRMCIKTYLLANSLIIFLDCPIRKYKSLELIREVIEKSLDLVNSLLRMPLVLPVKAGLKNGDNF